ncbi:putative signaling protein [Lysinibacillus sp. PLM2]|nr:putative signaling protein [Lysinibacillus sp. PLM2]
MFSKPDLQGITTLEGEYSIPIVILSIIIACVASYTALFMNERVKQNIFFNKYFWMFLASIAMGLGIWSMHFIGMSAFMLPIPMNYNLILTIISIFPAVFAFFMAFYFANKTSKTNWHFICIGILMGLGISSMHYVGMAAMEMEAKYYYKPWPFFSSIVIASGVSYIAILIFSKLQSESQPIKLIVSILMGLAISSMHYVGMSAVVFYVEGSIQSNLHHMHIMNMTSLIVIITIGIFCLFFFAGLTSLLGRYADYRLNYFDALTRFPNQRQFEKHLKSMKVSGSLAILHIDQLEKWISAYGYSFGDKIIKIIGEFVQSLKTNTSRVYRIEANRFAILDSKEQHSESLKASIESILKKLKNPLIIDNHRIKLDAVCAISHSDDIKRIEELFSNSMAVLQHPSIQYDHQVIEYDSKIHTFNLERRIIEDIDFAMENQDLFLVFQPKVWSKTKELSGLEALIRWNHPKFGMISPGLFIPILEEQGKIYDVTDWVVEKVCQQIVLFIEEGIHFSHVSINIPGSYITSPRLINVIKENLLKYNIDSRLIELEITETSVIHDIENAITAVSKFKEIGVSVALDDFGTGMSSLSYLKKMPISTIKIDKSFVDGVPTSEKDSAVLKAIITLCYSLNFKVVIEGVETKEQFEFITSFTEAPHIQGYYFSKPLKVNELKGWNQARV